MFDMRRCYNRPIVPPIVPPIVDQTCTFQHLIPMGDLSKYDQRGHASPSGYWPLLKEEDDICGTKKKNRVEARHSKEE